LLLLLASVCWLHGAALAWFTVARPSSPGQPSPAARTPAAAAFRSALRHLLPLVVAALLTLALYLLLDRLADVMPKPAFRLASWLTLKLRKPVKPDTVLHTFNTALWIVRWAALPALMLTKFAAIEARGWAGLGAFGALCRRPLYWLETPLLLFCALRVPFYLGGWVPYVGGFWIQMLSFAVRFGCAYLLFVASWLALVFLTSGGKPALSQPSTVPSP